jgi:hypothetical protein
MFKNVVVRPKNIIVALLSLGLVAGVFMENFENTCTRESISLEFIELFKQQKGIPVHILLQPLLRKLE